MPVYFVSETAVLLLRAAGVGQRPLRIVRGFGLGPVRGRSRFAATGLRSAGWQAALPIGESRVSRHKVGTWFSGAAGQSGPEWNTLWRGGEVRSGRQGS